MSWALYKGDEMMKLNHSQTLSIALTRVFAALALAVAVLSPSAGAAAAEGYTTARKEIQAEGYWNSCSITDGIETCTSTMIEVLGVDARSTTEGSYKGERACVFIITHSMLVSEGASPRKAEASGMTRSSTAAPPAMKRSRPPACPRPPSSR